eukprot:g6440.t1
MSTSVVPSGRTDRVNILYDVENGLSEGNYERAYTEGYLFRSWTPQFLTTEYSVSYSLPEDIYGALIASFVSLNPDATACQRACAALMILSPVLLSFLFAVVGQVAGLYYILNIVQEMQQQQLHNGIKLCMGGDYFLRLICTTAYYATVGISIFQTIDLFKWITAVPKYKPEDLHVLKRLNYTFGLHFSIEKVVGQGREGEVGIKKVAYGGITKVTRVMWYLIAIFKIILEVTLLVVGSAYILYANTNEDLILNSVSLVFVADFDNIAYSYALTETMKRVLSKQMPKFGYVRQAEDPKIRMSVKQTIWQILGPWFKILLFVSVPSSIWFLWC